MDITGIIPPLVTPFDVNEDIDEQALREEVRYFIQSGVHGLTVAGSTGEGHTLTAEDAVRVASIAVEEAAGQTPVIVGIIADSTREVVRRGRMLADVGVDGLQITPVHYVFNPGPDGTYSFYDAIGAAIDLPIVIYNVVPWNAISPDTLLRLAEIPNVVAVKQSGGDIHALAELLRANSGRLRVLTAVDDLLLPSFILGAEGAVAAILTVLPDLTLELWDACQRGDYKSALSLHERILPVWTAMNKPDMSSRTKALIRLRGRDVGNPRGPLQPVSAEVEKQLQDALSEAGVL